MSNIHLGLEKRPLVADLGAVSALRALLAQLAVAGVVHRVVRQIQARIAQALGAREACRGGGEVADEAGALSRARRDASLRALVARGLEGRVFCRGADRAVVALGCSFLRVISASGAALARRRGPVQHPDGALRTVIAEGLPVAWREAANRTCATMTTQRASGRASTRLIRHTTTDERDYTASQGRQSTCPLSSW